MYQSRTQHTHSPPVNKGSQQMVPLDVHHAMDLPLHFVNYPHQYHGYKYHVQNILYITPKFVHLAIYGIEYIDQL